MTALRVVKYLLSKGVKDKIRLQKLTYISYGYYWYNEKKELFDDRIEAWQYGAVIPNVYNYKGVYSEITDLTPKEKRAVKEVLRIYNNTKPFELVRLIHQKNTPYSKVYEDGKNKEIPKDLIKEHYEQLLNVLDVFKKPYVIDAIKSFAKR